MKVLVLARSSSPVYRIIEESGDDPMNWHDPIDETLIRENRIELAVSHGYRQIVKQDVIDALKGRIINLHISLLPWNRGADPNLWSFLDDTPKGVTIHYIDPGIDTGDVIVQKEVIFGTGGETLSTTYLKLQEEMIGLFGTHWPAIREGRCRRRSQSAGGTFHRSSDKERYRHLLTSGWDTPVALLLGKGKDPNG